VPALHADDGYVPDVSDVIAAVAGLVGGVVVSQLLPLDDPGAPQDPSQLASLRRAHLQPAPVPLRNGAGIAIAGTL
jgi:hypothetical protein